MTTSITIYSPTGGVVHDVSITKDAKVFRQLGGDYYVELSFSVDDTLALPKGSYILVDPTLESISDPETDNTEKYKEKYALKRDASPEPISGVNGYKYVLKFYSRQHDMEACQIKWLAGGSKELSFRVTTSLRGFAKLIADNMNEYLGFTDDTEVTNTDNAWLFDSKLDDTDMREQSFEGVSCWEAINSIANLFGVEWWIDHGKQLTIRFGKCENDGDATDIREGEIVNRFPAPKRGDDSNYGTRFYIFGGTQNVPEDYRSGEGNTPDNTTFHIAEKRICLREFSDNNIVAGGYIPYFDAIKVPQAEIVEKTIILDDTFPKNETTIGTGDILEQKENIIEGETAQPVYYIKVSKKPTVLSTLGITFTSGALSGRSFGASYTKLDGADYIKVHHTTESSGGASLIAVPNANLKPEVGNKYILTGVELSEDRIKAAEYDLWVKGTELARKYAHDTNVYDCATNPVYCAENDVNLDLGAKVMLKGAHFGESGRSSRIQGYEKKLYNPYIATYNIGDNSIYSRTLQGYKIYSMPVLEAVATTERTNEGLKQQISSMQDKIGLVDIQRRLGELEGIDKEASEVTADDNSVPGAKLYAAKVAASEAQAKAKTAQDNAISHCNIAVGDLGAEVAKLRTDVQDGLPGTRNFAIYAGAADQLSINTKGEQGVGVKFTAQFKNVYDLSNSIVGERIPISRNDASIYAGAIIAIDRDFEERVMTDEALVSGDVIMAINGRWVKINDAAGGSSSGEISDKAFYYLYEALTGIKIDETTGYEYLTPVPVTSFSTSSPPENFKPKWNNIYEIWGGESGTYQVPLPDMEYNYDDTKVNYEKKIIIRCHSKGQLIDFSNWQNTNIADFICLVSTGFSYPSWSNLGSDAVAEYTIKLINDFPSAQNGTTTRLVYMESNFFKHLSKPSL